MKSSTLLSLAGVAGVAVIMLVIGLTGGSVLFPLTRTETTTQKIMDTDIVTQTTTIASTITVSSISTLTQIETTSVISPTLISTSSSIACTVSAAGTGLYVTLESDSGQPLSGVQVSGTAVIDFSNGESCQEYSSSLATNTTGSVVFGADTGSYYLLSILYQGENYTATAPVYIMQSTYLTLRVPSGNISVTEIPFGGCIRNSTETLCPG
jgi:hypothetical protein